MKTIFAIFFILFTFSIPSFSAFGRGGSSGTLKKIIRILETMQKTQTGMNLETITIKLKEMEQIENQIRQLQNDAVQLANEARNLKSIGEDIKSKNINKILDSIIKLQNYRTEAELTLVENQAKLDNISKYFSLNQNEFKQGGEWTQAQAKKVEERVEKMRDDVKKITAKLNQKTETGYSLRKEDLERLLYLTRDIQNADGIVAVTQALGHLVGLNTMVLMDIKELLKDQNTLIANTYQAEQTEEDTQKERAKEEREENEKIHEDFKKMSEKSAKSSVKIEFKKIR